MIMMLMKCWTKIGNLIVSNELSLRFAGGDLLLLTQLYINPIMFMRI